MENNELFQYLKLLMEYMPLWLLLIILVAIWAAKKPRVWAAIPKYIRSAKVGDLELEFREVKEEIKAARQQVEELQNEVAMQGEARVREILEEFDGDAAVNEFSAQRQAIKATATSLESLDFVKKGLSQTENTKELYAAAEIARTRRDVGLFDDLVKSLEKLANDNDLLGVRFHTVWTITSAIHKTLIADIKHTGVSRLTTEQLTTAKSVLMLLMKNPKVLQDRPDAPKKGIRGPAGWSITWIENALAGKVDSNIENN